METILVVRVKHHGETARFLGAADRRRPANPLGERWIGFIRGDGWTIGIHGTPQPELLGRAVSKGCIRMRNDDVIRLYDRVRIGTPVVVEP